MDEAAATSKAVSIDIEKYNSAMWLYRPLALTFDENKGIYDWTR
jgi:hypothetical protein